MSDAPAVRLETRDRVVVLHLSHGPNALDETLIDALDGELARLDAAGAPPLVLASAHPSIFCPGLDLRKVDGLPREGMRRFMVRFNTLLRRLVSYPGPTVAALAGHAIAGGCLLSLACDRRVMAAWGARLGLSEINLGIPVPAGAVHMLVALYPTRAVEQLVLEGDGFPGERALQFGVVERLAEPEAGGSIGPNGLSGAAPGGGGVGKGGAGPAGGVVASGDAPIAGIVRIAPHSGHLAFLPAVSS